MKVLLPAVLAFLLCFAGGLFLPLPGKNPPDTTSHYLVLPLMEVGGYEDWTKEMSGRMIKANLKRTNDELGNIKTQLDVLKGEIENIDKAYKPAKTAKNIGETDLERANEAAKEGPKLVIGLKNLKRLDPATNEPKSMDERLRMAQEWITKYREAKKAHEKAVEKFKPAKKNPSKMDTPSRAVPKEGLE